MLFGKHVNKYYLKYAVYFLLGVAALVAVDIVQTYIPQYLGQIIDNDVILINDPRELTQIIFHILLFAIIMFLGRVVWRLTIFRASTGIEANIRRAMFQKAERLPTSYYHENKVGNVMNWFTSDIQEIGDFYGWGTVMIVDAAFLSVTVFIKMITLNIWMTLIALFPILLIIVWGALLDRIMTKEWGFRQKQYDKLYDFSQENFTGIRVIKAFVKQNKEVIAFSRLARNHADAAIKYQRIDVFFDIIIETILALAFASVLGFGGMFVYMTLTGNPVILFGQEVKLTVGQIVEFVGYLDLIIWPMIALGQIISMRSRAKGSLKRISAFLDAEENIKNPENAVVLENAKGFIDFKGFTFVYPGSNKPSIDGVSFSIQAGEKIGIVGKIGSGKTTLVNSLLRLYNVEKGQIYIDGVDLMDLDIPSLREAIAYAPQDNFLFGDKIENNIAFSSKEVDHDKVEEAAKFADVHSNIVDFQKGYETITGERGVTLSGGQKQRVSVARAYYKDAPILILDDCVSAVDVKTEETILSNINEKREGRTTILIASRVSSVRHMDKIVVLDEGRLDSFGSHEELMKTSALYQRMVFLQELEKEVEGGKR